MNIERHTLGGVIVTLASDNNNLYENAILRGVKPCYYTSSIINILFYE